MPTIWVLCITAGLKTSAILQLLTMSSLPVDYSSADRLYPGSPDAHNRVYQWRPTGSCPMPMWSSNRARLNDRACEKRCAFALGAIRHRMPPTT